MERLRKLPIEFWVLLVLPGIFLIFFFTTRVRFNHAAAMLGEEFFGSVAVFVPYRMIQVTLILLIYAAGRSLFWIWRELSSYLINKPADQTWWKHRWADMKSLAKDLLIILAPISIASIYKVCTLIYMGTFDPGRIYSTGIMMMGWDKAVFGSYLPFWLQGHSWSPIVDTLSLEAYLQLTTMTTLVTLGLIVIGKVPEFRQFILSFFLAFILAMPIWFTFPTVTPNELFRENVFAAPIDTPMAQYTVAQSQLIGPMTTELLFNVSHMQSNPAINHYHVPTFPSMHVAWGIVLVYFAFVIAWPVGILFTLWWVLNITGAVFSLQHFGVDVIAGTIIGSLAFVVSGYLLRFEDKFLAVPKTTHRTLRYVSEDIAHLTHTVIRKLKKLSKFKQKNTEA